MSYNKRFFKPDSISPFFPLIPKKSRVIKLLLILFKAISILLCTRQLKFPIITVSLLVETCIIQSRRISFRSFVGMTLAHSVLIGNQANRLVIQSTELPSVTSSCSVPNRNSFLAELTQYFSLDIAAYSSCCLPRGLESSAVGGL